jgi:hypothetical protein
LIGLWKELTYAGYAGRKEQTGGSPVQSITFVVISNIALILVWRCMLTSTWGPSLCFPQYLFGESSRLYLFFMECHQKSAPFSGLSFSCAERLKDHQAKMKNKSYICSTWYVSLHSPCGFCLKYDSQWENVYKRCQRETTHQEEALQLKR